MMMMMMMVMRRRRCAYTEVLTPHASTVKYNKLVEARNNKYTN
jgi:hypothetical protein